MLLATDTEVIFTGETKLDWRSGLGCLSFFILPSLVFLLAVLTNAKGDWIAWLAVTLAAFSLIYTFWLIVTSPFKRFRNEVLSKLIRSLSPLRPSMTELAEIMKMLEPLKMKIVKKVKLSDLMAKIESDSEFPFSSHPIH